MSHTNGPWHVEHDRYVCGPRGVVIADVQRPDDARLLATAPDLLAALRLILESFTEPEDDNEILRQARAAIAKATGGAP